MACLREVREKVPGLPDADTVFVGGGTPSLVPAPLLCSVLEAMSRKDGAETTIECNPDTVTAELVAHYRHAGVTRISLGVQSMVPSVLAGLGRTHDTESVGRAVRLVRAGGIDGLSLDVIFGGAGESLDDWRTTLSEVLSLEPDHVSAYALTVEPGTALAADASRHPDPDRQADAYAIADQMLSGAGYLWYEISNWARPGHQCRHNLLYWRQGDYQGFGCAAHSHARGERWWNVRTPERYIAAIEEGRSPIADREILDAPTRWLEKMSLALRTSAGVPASALHDSPDLEGLIERREDRLVLTVRGRLLANEVALRLRPPQDALLPTD